MDRRMIAPVAFGLLFVVIVAGYAAVFFLVPIPLVFKVVIGLAVAGVAAAMVYVLRQRWAELKEEDRSDFGKY